MIFSSVDFLIFLLLVLGYIIINKNASETNKKTFLLIASYYFYAYWDWRFLSLILLITYISYYCAKIISQTENQHKRSVMLAISVVSSLTILGIFKYYNFFIDSINLMMPLGSNPLSGMNIILPLGISFYTFHTISYTIDVYRREIPPAHPLDYALAIVFFPQLVAGPIVRASEFIPQLSKRIVITKANLMSGLSMFILGFAKKSLLADSLAIYVDIVFKHPELYDAPTLIFAIMSYSLQIYLDFSGYSDMAMGVAKMFGFDLPQNFNYPYKSKNVVEFWHRWHMTLSRWLRDYLYISLGGNRRGKKRTYFNLMATMTLGGLWHGASFNFLFWGIFHGSALVLHKIFHSYVGLHRIRLPFASDTVRTHFVNSLSILTTYVFICFTWVLFRAHTYHDTMSIFHTILTWQDGISWTHVSFYLIVPGFLIWHLLPNNDVLRKKLFSLDSYLGITNCMLLSLVILLFSPTGTSPFIYFQF